jgi:hypothetical protein
MSLKNIKWFLVIAIGLFFFIGCNNKEKAIKYNDTIIEEMNKLSKLEDAVTSKQGSDGEKAFEDFKNAVPESRKAIEAAGKFKDSESFGKAALALCDFYQEVVDGKWNDKSGDDIGMKEVELFAALKQAQKDFAERFKIEIVQP